ncbi:MAG: lysophospholipid acyltransferase family protein [Planctomycetota bacterium]|nr:lysophospholipid acyltransferase family protein [Planctomycetota bacterium]
MSASRMRSLGAYRAALRAARGAAGAALRLMPGTAATVRENLRLAFGHSDEALVRRIYRHFGEAAVDLMFFSRLFDPLRLPEHFSFEGDGWSHYRKTNPSAAVFVTGHLGNWELYGAAFGHVGIPLDVVARPLDQNFAARWLTRSRRRRGMHVLDKDAALPLALKSLRRGRCVAFLIDQAAGRHGVDVPFFGRPARTFTGPAALAHKLGLPLYAGYSTRLGDGIRYRCFAEPVAVTGDAEGDTAVLNRILEGYVRSRPEQWWWFHRRFKPPKKQRRGRALTPAGIPVQS